MRKEAQAFTHLAKVFWPKEDYTKSDLIAYYRAVAAYILPYLKNRPVSLNRFPDGIRGIHFFQKNIEKEGLPDFVQTLSLRAKTTGKNVRYVLCNNLNTLLYLANIGCIELHPWNSRKGSLGKPDYLVFDLDPGSASSFNDVIKVAQALRKILQERRIKSFCKTSGKRGLHVYVPTRIRSYDAARVFARKIAEETVQQLPKIASLEHWPKDRKDKVYIDLMRNAAGQTTVTPYSLRPVPGATVSTPLAWGEVKSGLRPEVFTLRTIPERLKIKSDVWNVMR